MYLVDLYDVIFQDGSVSLHSIFFHWSQFLKCFVCSKLQPNACTALTTQNGNQNYCVISHASNTTALQSNTFLTGTHRLQVTNKWGSGFSRAKKKKLPMSAVKSLVIDSKKKVKCFRYRPGVAQRVCRGIALLFHDRGTRRGWVVSSTPRPHFTPGKDSVPILQEAGWAPGSVWTGGKSRPHRDSIPDRPAHSSVAIPTELPAHSHCQ